MISLGICSTVKESKYVAVFYLHTMLPSDFQYRDIHQD